MQPVPVHPEPLVFTPTREDRGRISALEDTVWFELHPGLTAEDLTEPVNFDCAGATEADLTDLPGVTSEGAHPITGFYTAYDMQVTVPGRLGTTARLPLSGLTWVGVHPDHRRRGILRALMRHHLHGLHARGDAAVAGLWAAEVGIYGRFGYGTATLNTRLRLGKGASLQAPPAVAAAADEVRTHMVRVDSEEATEALHQVALTAAAGTLGAVTRGASLRRVWFRDFPTVRGAKEPWQLVLATRDGRPTGYAVIRRESKWSDHDVPEGSLDVRELAAVDPPSLLALARRLTDFDLIASVTLGSRGLDDPLLWWAGGPRSASVSVSDAVWLRLVDVPAALAARGYAVPVDVVLDVTDEFCPWNTGRWRLSADEDGRGRCETTTDSADIELPVHTLGAAYAGGRSIAAQALTGEVVEVSPGAVRRLSLAMRGDTEPLGTIGF